MTASTQRVNDGYQLLDASPIMVETPKADQELRFRNVSLHNGGRTEHGTLHLTRHHLLFSYYPNVQRNGDSAVHARDGVAKDSTASTRPSISLESSGLSQTSTASPSAKAVDAPPGSHASKTGVTTVEVGSNVDYTKDRRKEERPRQRPKEIWVPYPLIHSCVLRPSHSPHPATRTQNDGADTSDDEDELFPPTFGTASHDTRPSTDSARLAPYSPSPRPTSPARSIDTTVANDSGRQPAIRIRCRDFRMMALHFHVTSSGAPPDDTARQAFYVLRRRCCVDKIHEMHAFHFHPPSQEVAAAAGTEYDARREYARMGISAKAADGPGSAWRISDINHDYSYSATYPNVLCVPRTVSDNMLKYGGAFRSRCRIPCLAYLHPNGGSITRSSQPMVGVQNKRNPQDERLVSAIFSSHTPPLQSPEDSPPQLPSLTSPSTTTLESSASDPASLENDVIGLPTSQSETNLDEIKAEKAAIPRRKIYGSTRRNLIVDARPKMNALANRATGGGMEDVANYAGPGDTPVEKVFLNIANIHVMRASLEKVVGSLANSDYIQVKPDQEQLRKSGWLGHIAGMLDGVEMVARVVGLGGSHVLIHCSDGWDRTAQVSALAQIMLDPHYRSLDGFISLVQKEFLSFGHKFRDRDGIEGSEKWFEIENERIAPSRNRESNESDPNSLNTLGVKALTGAKNWFEKNRSNIFRQQNASRDNLGDRPVSRPASPPPNPVIHAPPSATSKDEKEHRMSEKEVSPIFHQFLDAVYQLQHQNSTAFEFNERFLKRLFFHAYSCQYGEFLFNTEKERNQYKSKVASVWPHFLARRQEFINQEYVAKVDDPLLFPKRQNSDREIEVRWWSSLFQRQVDDMNLPRALAPADPPAITATLGSSASFDERTTESEKTESTASLNGMIKETKSTPNLSTMGESVTNNFSSLGIQTNDTKVAAATELIIPQQSTDFEVIPKQEDLLQSKDGPVISESRPPLEQMAVEYDGDPLGVTKSMSRKPETRGLDFAAFASQNAFRDR